MVGPEKELKVIGYPELMYLHLRDVADSKKTTNREVIRTAVANHMKEVLALCARAGFAPSEGDRKLVRTAIDPAVIKELRSAAETSGLDATTLVILCLRHHLEMRLVDGGRDGLLKRLKRRFARKSSNEASPAATDTKH